MIDITNIFNLFSKDEDLEGVTTTKSLNELKTSPIYYVGMWKNNTPNGYGEKTVFLENQTISLKGNYVDNSLNGVGEVNYGDDYYYGEWSNNKYDGYGIYIFEDGDIQQGKFEEGKLVKEMVFCYKDNLDGSKKIPTAVELSEGCGSAEEVSAIDYVNWINNSESVSLSD